MKFSETVTDVISLATAIRNYWDTELPKRHPTFPIVLPGEDSGPPPPEQQQLRSLLTALPEDDIFKLTLLMHLGRRDLGTNNLEQHLEALKQHIRNPDRAVAQLMGKALLANYLRDGLAELTKSGIDADQLAPTEVGSDR
jgi:hypothetical protein